MPAEKKKVNLVNLKTKFGVFLHNHFCCQVCYSIDKLAFGFTCEHKFCSKCNDNHMDQCKECQNVIENVATNDGMFPYLEDLKDIMSIDMNKVANKLRQSNVQTVPKKANKEVDVIEKVVKIKQADAKTKERQTNENDEPMNDQIEDNDKSVNRSENEDRPVPSRTSKRQATKKVNESKKNSSLKQSKTDAEVEKVTAKTPEKALPKQSKVASEADKVTTKTPEKPSSKQSKADVEVEKVTTKTPEKPASRTRDMSRTKSLQDYVKESIKEKPITELKEVEKTVTKSIRKNDRSAKSAKQPSLVIISTSITENELRILNKFAKKFNAKIVNDYSDDITHLVTLETKPDSRLTTRTLKYLKSLLAHKWLLDFKWIKESLDNEKLVDESDYELLGITKQSDGNLGAPKRSRESKDVKLFEGKKFFIEGKFGPKCGLPKNDYKELVKVGGGDVIESEKDVQDDTYIIIEASHLNKSKYKGRSNSMSTTDFLNCVSDFKFDL